MYISMAKGLYLSRINLHPSRLVAITLQVANTSLPSYSSKGGQSL